MYSGSHYHCLIVQINRVHSSLITDQAKFCCPYLISCDNFNLIHGNVNVYVKIPITCNNSCVVFENINSRIKDMLYLHRSRNHVAFLHDLILVNF